MYNKHKKNIIAWACITRLVIIVVQFIGNFLIPDHDAKVFIYPKANLTTTSLDNFVQVILGGFVRWDVQYFMHIAKYGYAYENSLAFFPLYPLLVRFLAWPISVFVTFLNEDSLLLVCFILLNWWLFVKTSIVLYDLSLKVLNKELAYMSAILFCFNPASIFFVAPYTECIFTYLTFKSMLNIMLMFDNHQNECDKFKSVIYAIIPLSLSTGVRSNGVLNVGFILYFMIQYYMKIRFNCFNFCKFLLSIFLITLICLVPFFLVQMYAYLQYCTNFDNNLPNFLVNYGESNNFVMPGLVAKYNQSWCFKRIPLAYSYVQDRYWNVGFLRYFEFKQTPNFLLAFPIMFIILSNSFKFIKQHFEYCINLGVFRFKVSNYFEKEKISYNKNMFVFIVHSVVLTIFCWFCIHVQVTTRMLCSASPVLYWFCSYYFEKLKWRDVKIQTIFLLVKNGTREQKFILIYFISYYLVGTILFANFLPWT